MYRGNVSISLAFAIACMCAGFGTGEASAQCEQAKLVAQDGSVNDDFGVSVSISGDYAVVGARWDDGDEMPFPSNAGSAYVFRWSGAEWEETTKLTAGGDSEAGDEFGASVAISGDYILVGVEFDDDGGFVSGSAFTFRRDGDDWVEDAKLAASDAAELGHFGRSVAIDGTIAAISAVGGSSSVYVFERGDLEWSEKDKLLTWAGSTNDKFGEAVSVSGDYILVGAPEERDPNIGYRVGAAYVFVKSAGEWAGQARLTASDASATDFFGGSVSISGDWAVVGADCDDDACPEDGQADCGAAYVFKRVRNRWTEEARLTPNDTYPGQKFGRSVSIDGNYIVVGTEYDNHAGTDSGTAYVFALEGDNWVEQAKLIATDASLYDEFGAAVAISGNRALIGAPGDNPDTGSRSGSGYIFTRMATTWGVHSELYDLSDIAYLQDCFTGNGVWDLSPCCSMLDSDSDGDVDGDDYFGFYGDFVGP